MNLNLNLTNPSQVAKSNVVYMCVFYPVGKS